MSDIKDYFRLILYWNQLPACPSRSGSFHIGKDYNWNFSDLYRKMRVTLGGGVRSMVYELVVRTDIGVSEEGGEVQMFFNHPY